MTEDESNPASEPPQTSQSSRPRSRRQPMTPALRRFLGPARSWHGRQSSEYQAAKPEDPKLTSSNLPPMEQIAAESAKSFQSESPTTVEPERVKPPPTGQALAPAPNLSHAIGMQRALLMIGGCLLLAATFYLGIKAHRVKNFIAGRSRVEHDWSGGRKFPGLSANELVEQGLAAERLGKWREAVERFVVAKERNNSFRGILFRAGKLCYDHGDFDTADRVLARAAAADDHADTANYLRGLIAVGHNDLTAAEYFFEAAANADPFTPSYYYYWAEALRRDHRPREAIQRYEQSAARAVNEQDALLSRFKARLARAEAAETSQLEAELQQRQEAGKLSVDWLLTKAALQIRAGEIADAARLITEARGADEPRLFSLFAACTSDMLYIEASRNHPEIAQACQVGKK